MRQPLGQHFLRDPHALQTILEAAELHGDDLALEIGPGKGALTDLLAPRVGKLVAVELDRALAGRLATRFQGFAHCRIHQGDFLIVDLPALFPEAGPDRSVKILGNLPYSITSPIFEKILAWPSWQTGVFLIQREVGERMRSEPGSRTFGILSLAVQLFAEVEKIILVKPGAFLPPPRVMSMVVRLRRKTRPDLPPEQIQDFFDLAHGAFAHRRKTLANSLALHAEKPKEVTTAWLHAQGIDPRRRAESLAVSDYVRLAPAWAIFRREINLT